MLDKATKVFLPVAFAGCIVFSGCASGYRQFYKPLVDVKTLQDVQTLNPNEKPQIFSSSDLERDIKVARSRGYVPIGQSAFNGEMESERGIIQQAHQNGAVMVLVYSKFTGTQTFTTPVFVPNNQTTYTSGTIYGPRGSATYSGTTTTYGTTAIPVTTHQRRYDQTAVYFVKSTHRPKFGLAIVNIPPELRSKFERNTGALVDIVMEESPAFAANVLPGDLLIEINGTAVMNAKQASEAMAATSKGVVPLKIIRNGSERVINVALDQN